MATDPHKRAPLWPAFVFLLWTLLGVAAFLMQSMQDLAELARTDPVQARLWAEMPLWVWMAYGMAVGAGLAGALALLLRRRSAVWLAGLCLIAVLVQFGHTILLTDLVALRGWSAALFPLLIIAMALAQLLYARWLGARGTLR
jgi:hypothetical protein